MPSTRLDLQVAQLHGANLQQLSFNASRLICCGWVGRDRAALEAHIEELAQLGIPRPTRMPIFMSFTTHLLTTDGDIGVISPTTSGEVEYVLLCRDGDIWVTVGSDQTDRDVETKSIPASKQMCAKVLARGCWPYAEVRDHWNALMMRCWVESSGQRTLYQEGTMDAILSPYDLLTRLPDPPMPKEGLVVFSGTIATRSGLVYGDAYDLELQDPVLQRCIRASYRVTVLPQHV